MENVEKRALKEVLKIREEKRLNQLISIARPVEFAGNQMILNIGEKQDYVYFITKGIARSFYLDLHGNDMTKMLMKEYDFCVGESLFEEGESVQGFEALENMQALKFNAAELKEILLSDSELIRVYIDYLEQNLIYKMKRENSFQTMSATERYKEFRRNSGEMEKRVNSFYIASYLGMTPESLSRIKRAIGKQEPR